MMGPEILANTLSVGTARSKGVELWQYHSRSDSHSKIACWTLLLDVLIECDVVRSHAEKGLLGFGINHVVVGPINKTLDLVLTRLSPGVSRVGRKTFASLGREYSVRLNAAEQGTLDALPVVHQDLADDVSEVAMAVEAKACMTEHIKSLPRLHAEILATGYLAKRAIPRAIAVSITLVNVSDSFVSPSGKGKVNKHSQPSDANRVLEMLGTAIPLARDTHNLIGYDVVGALSVHCKNDGSPVTIVDGVGAPTRGQHIHYERMVRSICSEYRSRFGS